MISLADGSHTRNPRYEIRSSDGGNACSKHLATVARSSNNRAPLVLVAAGATAVNAAASDDSEVLPDDAPPFRPSCMGPEPAIRSLRSSETTTTATLPITIRI